MVSKGKKTLHCEVPCELMDTIKRVAIDQGTSVTNIIIKYLEFLRKTHYKQRIILDEHSQGEGFKLDS